MIHVNTIQEMRTIFYNILVLS